MKNTFLSLLVFLLFFSGSTEFIIEGYKPVYVSADEAKLINTLEARDVETQGKIYINGQYIFVGDVNQGVHVIDNSNPVNPQKIAFIQIYGNHDIAIKGNILYADNLDDLIAIDITDMQNPQVVKRIEDVYELPNQNYPENVEWGSYFECSNPEKGIVVGWVLTELENPDCRTSY